MKFFVKKLGGENAAELDKSSNNVIEDFNGGKKQAIVISAIRSPKYNTTDNLIELSLLLKENSLENIFTKIDEIQNFHLDIISNKLKGNHEDIKNIIIEKFLELKNNIIDWFESGKKEDLPKKENDYSIELSCGKMFSILGFGEELSSIVFAESINSKGVNSLKAIGVNLSSLVSGEEVSGLNETQLFSLLSDKIVNQINYILERGEIPVLPGYLGTFPDGIENSIGRGYTDATAAILSVGLSKTFEKVVLEVQKSVKGLLSCDPRMLDKGCSTKKIDKINYLTALEIIGARGAQAKLLHHQSLREEVQEAGVKIHLFDPFSEDKSGTWIGCEKDETSQGVEFIGARKDITFISVSSGRMGIGFLYKVGQILQKYVSVDIISASETEISFTVDSKDKEARESIRNMVIDLRQKLGFKDNDSMEFVESLPNQALIFCVGQNMKDRCGLLLSAVNSLSQNGINIELMSQGRLQRAMIFGVDSKDMKKAVNALHKNMIENKSKQNEVVKENLKN